MLHHLTIIGLGLIGSSIARDAKALGLADKITGIDTNAESLQLLRHDNIIDESSSLIDSRIKDSEIIVIASPPSVFEKIAHAIKPYLSAETVITDTGSIKQQAIHAISKYLPDPSRFVPAHPIAGSEQSGAAAGQRDLFQGKRVILTTNETTSPEARDKVAAFWQALGGVVGEMDAHVHDLIYAHVSHLPQAIAYALLLTLKDYVPQGKHLPFLRLAGSNPDLWTDIFLANRMAISPAMQVTTGITQHFISEFDSGAEAGHTSNISEDAATKLFPRIIASVLISTVQNAELKYGKRMAPFVGSGFADMTSLAMEPPDVDIEKISENYKQVTVLLKSFAEHFGAIAIALEAEDKDALHRQLAIAQHEYLKLSN